MKKKVIALIAVAALSVSVLTGWQQRNSCSDQRGSCNNS